MIYLIVKMLVLLLIAGGFGAAFGWFMRGAEERDARTTAEREAAARLADLRAARDAAEAKLRATLEAPKTGSTPDPETLAKLDEAAAKLKESDRKLAEAAVALQTAEDRAAAATAETAAMTEALARVEGRFAELDGASDATAAAPIAGSPAGSDPSLESAPPAIPQPGDGGDDLRQISGVGPKIETILHEHGIWRFRQIAELTSGQIAWLDDKLTFRGRIEREDWIGQAKALVGDVA